MRPMNQLCVVLALIVTARGYELELISSSGPATYVQGDIVPVVVSVENQGDRTFRDDVAWGINCCKLAQFCNLNNDGFGDVVLGGYNYSGGQGRVWLYYDTTSSATDVTFNWNTSNVSLRSHIIKVELSPVVGKNGGPSVTKTTTVAVKSNKNNLQGTSGQEEPQKDQAASKRLQSASSRPTEKPTTSFTVAAVDGDMEQVKLHLASGTDINEKTISGDTALHYAIKGRHQNVAELLIAEGADINSRNRDGETPAHLAIKTHQSEVLELLLTKGATVSPPHLAAYKGDLAAIKKFVEGRISVNAADESGLTLLHAAASGGRTSVVEYLIDQGTQVNAYDKKKQTPLFCAAAAGHEAIVGLLVDKGADLNPEREPDHWTPLYVAVEFGYKNIVELLIAKGGEVNIKTLIGNTALHAVALRGDRELAELLVVNGADLNVRNARWLNTPLHLAVVKGHMRIVELLATKGANLDTKNADGFTPLHYAVSRRRLSWWETRVGDSSTPNDLAIVDLLVINGVDVNVKSDNGATPLSLAKRGGMTKIVELLRKRGAKE